jgi:hypothetical protein
MDQSYTTHQESGDQGNRWILTLSLHSTMWRKKWPSHPQVHLREVEGERTREQAGVCHGEGG